MFGVGGGSTSKVSGSNTPSAIYNKLKNNVSKTIMSNTTRKVAGQIVSKSTKGVVKNVTKNLLNDFAMSAVTLSSSFAISKVIGYGWLKK